MPVLLVKFYGKPYGLEEGTGQPKSDRRRLVDWAAAAVRNVVAVEMSVAQVATAS